MIYCKIKYMGKTIKIFNNSKASIYRALIIYGLSVAIVAAGIVIGWKIPLFGSLSIPRTNGVVFDESLPIEKFELIDHSGDSFVFNRLQDIWSFIYFGYTHCPDICPTALSILARLNTLRSEEAAVPVQYIFVSIDPERDSLPILKSYTEYFFSNLIGITGSIDELTSFASELAVSFEFSSETGEYYSVSHSDVLVLINPKGSLQAIFTPPYSADELSTDFDAIRDWYTTEY